MRFIDWLATAFQRFGRWTAGAIVPMFVRPVPPVALAGVVHFLLVVLIAVGLFYLQRFLGVTEKIGRGPVWLRPLWIPILFLLCYALLWAVVSLWLSLAPNQPTTDYPDLDAAWDEVLAALQKAGIGIADTPLFLVFGSPPATLDLLFRGLARGLMVAGGTSVGSPLRVYANTDGIYLAVSGASLLGAQDRTAIAGQSNAAIDSIGASIDFQSAAASVAAGTLDGGKFRELQQILKQAEGEKRPLSDDEKQRVRQLSGAPTPTPQLQHEAAERLTHLCGRIAATRWPLCPLNGAVLAVPMTAAETESSAQQWGLVAQQDLAVVEAGTKLRFPIYVLAGGVEDFPGGRLFFDRFATEKGGQRFGDSFPLNPDLPPAAVPAAIETSVNWVFENLLQRGALQLMRVEPSGGGKDTAANAELVRFLAEVRRRGQFLARLVSRALTTDSDRHPVFGGCYLWVKSQAKPGEVKFVRDFFKKVESTQGHVAWMPEAYAVDARYRALTNLGYAALGLVLLGVLGFAGYVIYTNTGR